MLSSRKRRIHTALVVLGLSLILLPVVIAPLYWLIKTSLERRGNLFVWPPQLLPETTFQAYRQVILDAPIILWMRNSLFVSSMTTFATIVLATFTSYSLSRFYTRTNRIVGYFILATQMVPGVIYMLPIFLQFTRWGLVDTHMGAIIAFATFSLPLCVWMLKGYFDSIPTELEGAAQIDGCTQLGAIFRVVVPLAFPGYIATIIYSFLLGWNEFVYALVLMRSSRNWLMANGLASFFGEFATSWDFIMAGAILYIIPPILLNLFMQRYLVQGLTAGAVKS